MIVWSIASWIGFFIFRIFLILAGYIMVPLAIAFKAYEMTDANLEKPADGPIYHFTWRIMFIWDNWEDGIANRNYKQFESIGMQIFYWSCIRNPANNVRITPYLSCKLDPEKITYTGTDLPLVNYKDRIPHWFYCRQGLYSCYFHQFYLFGELRRFWIGWKIIPQDTLGVDPNNYRYPGAGFASQFKRIRT